MSGIVSLISSLTTRQRSRLLRNFPAKIKRYAGKSGRIPIFGAIPTEEIELALAFPRYFRVTMPTLTESASTPVSVLKFVKLTNNAYIPTKGSKHSAGYDLYSAYDYTIEPMSNMLVKTDLQIAVPHGCYGRVAPRSGLALKSFIDVGAGVVDEDYRGNLGVVLFNFSKDSFKVSRGDRVAQFICEKIEYPELEEVQSLDQTDRGNDGFGSTGSN